MTIQWKSGVICIGGDAGPLRLLYPSPGTKSTLAAREGAGIVRANHFNDSVGQWVCPLA